MPDKFQNKYRIGSHRCPNWDYAGNSSYFITLVTQQRVCNLGTVKNDKVILSDFGKIVDDEWNLSFEIRNELFCDEYIIMPNHLHAILIIRKNGGDGGGGGGGRDARPCVSTGSCVSTDESSTIGALSHQKLYRKPQSLSSFVGGFKSAVNSKIDDYIDEQGLKFPKYNRNNHFFQPNYHDHIIRNHGEYLRIKNYIINNPFRWEEDRFNTKNE